MVIACLLQMEMVVFVQYAFLAILWRIRSVSLAIFFAKLAQILSHVQPVNFAAMLMLVVDVRNALSFACHVDFHKLPVKLIVCNAILLLIWATEI